MSTMSDPSPRVADLLARLAQPDLGDVERLRLLDAITRQGRLQTTVHLLPVLLRHDGKPYSLKNHFQFEPLFRTVQPKESVWMAARQVAKTMSISAASVIQCVCQENFKVLFITPLADQVRRISNNNVRPLIENSPIRGLLTNSASSTNVLQRDFLNGSRAQFSFAGQAVDRVRGSTADLVRFDEAQDLDDAHIPIVKEVMSHSLWELTSITGTPKTPENTLNGRWLGSSQAEWFIPCRHAGCRAWNIPAVEYHLDAMIGPWRDDISEASPGLVCHKCQKPLFAVDGMWVHRRPELVGQCEGFHLPQPVMWIHYSRPDKWAQLLAKRQGLGSYTPDKYHNEVLGEPYGKGTQLVSALELQAACNLPWKNQPDNPDAVLAVAPRYEVRVLAVDWGGGGEKEISLTALVVLGITSSGEIHAIWAKKLHTPNDHIGEARECLRIFTKFRCRFLAHDFTGAGVLRETFLVESGVPVNNVIPVSYVRASTQALMHFKPATDINPRNHYSVDKTRSLLLTCSQIRKRRLRFFRYDFQSKDDPGLLHDFLGLVEEKMPSRMGSDSYVIRRHHALPDDFAQAVNIGCCCLWYITKRWPTLADPVQDKSLSERASPDTLERPPQGPPVPLPVPVRPTVPTPTPTPTPAAAKDKRALPTARGRRKV